MLINNEKKKDLVFEVKINGWKFYETLHNFKTKNYIARLRG